MNFDESYDQLNRYEEEIMLLKEKVEILRKQLKEKSTELKTYSGNLTHEKRNLENLERFSFSKLLKKATGSHYKEIETANEKYASAKKEYNEKETFFLKLKQDIDLLHEEIDALKSRRDDLKNHILTAYPEGVKLSREIENRRTGLLLVRKEIKEAIDAVEVVIELSREAVESLSSAKGWSTFDTFLGGGLVSDIAKYSKLDEANQKIEKISAATEIMRKELHDIDMSLKSRMELISGGEKFFDIAFDNIFSDWSIRGKISTNLNRLEEFIEDLADKNLTLHNKMSEIDRELANL